jgi:hypothetical protein
MLDIQNGNFCVILYGTCLKQERNMKDIVSSKKVFGCKNLALISRDLNQLLEHLDLLFE